MKKAAYRFLGLALTGVAAMFVLTGSYLIFHKPQIPAELRK
ncbi:cyclic lactone autoinducer peptide [Paenibacillus rhizovicinus]|uniref:Cyclic lactone autoinducer peptide n=1 Tax=Paenibacillus rhizovicinus TaxID=2704463 RepID=A0A6C0P714_9BACL|nr:cyclic lactone autoinducer peptide [Paenibacillus rhizovicinus]QHW34136.1 cyclic lactone autoinducer peptide [Paenibacillus rhizovicinus]